MNRTLFLFLIALHKSWLRINIACMDQYTLDSEHARRVDTVGCLHDEHFLSCIYCSDLNRIPLTLELSFLSVPSKTTPPPSLQTAQKIACNILRLKPIL